MTITPQDILDFDQEFDHELFTPENGLVQGIEIMIDVPSQKVKNYIIRILEDLQGRVEEKKKKPIVDNAFGDSHINPIDELGYNQAIREAQADIQDIIKQFKL